MFYEIEYKVKWISDFNYEIGQVLYFVKHNTVVIMPTHWVFEYIKWNIFLILKWACCFVLSINLQQSQLLLIEFWISVLLLTHSCFCPTHILLNRCFAITTRRTFFILTVMVPTFYRLMILPTRDRWHAGTNNIICSQERYAPSIFQDSLTHFVLNIIF